MTTAIWKFALDFKDGMCDVCEVDMPCDAQVLSTAFQAEGLMAWAVVTPRNHKIKRKFRIYATGESDEEHAGSFIGTIFSGPYVFHVFDLGEFV